MSERYCPGSDPDGQDRLTRTLRRLQDDDLGPAVPGPARGAADLATAALRRARNRTRRRAFTTSIAAALAVVAVGTGVQAQLTAAGRQAPVPAGPSPTANLPGGPRHNLLLLGGDSGPDRTGVRPDSIIVASIDTATGDTLLVSLPRNLQRVPFPPGSPAAAVFPDGFSCLNPAAHANTECLLNSLWTWGDAHQNLYPGDKHPGLTATVQGVEQVTGLTIDDYVMLNLQGFADAVDALGGVDVTVTQRLPIGGSVEHPVATSWLQPGRQHLNGYQALWFARSRWSTDDPDRMARQRCLVSALARQVDPVRLGASLPKLLPLGPNLMTSVPLADIPKWVELGTKIRSARLRTLVLGPSVIDTTRPDIPDIRRMVTDALDPASGSPRASVTGADPAGTPTPTATARTKPARTPGSTPGPGTRSALDTAQVCQE
ncbi:MAG TPA: LCP family protein [Kineosporiaceae bacterium]|nr:LCP family protein [Kineosporiaceae bacterium]